MLVDTPTAPLPLPWQGGIPLKLEVSITPSDEVQALRGKVSDLTAQLQDLQARYNRTEYLYRCETLVNLQLSDLCKDCGVKVPPRLLQRPDAHARLP